MIFDDYIPLCSDVPSGECRDEFNFNLEDALQSGVVPPAMVESDFNQIAHPDSIGERLLDVFEAMEYARAITSFSTTSESAAPAETTTE